MVSVWLELVDFPVDDDCLIYDFCFGQTAWYLESF